MPKENTLEIKSMKKYFYSINLHLEERMSYLEHFFIAKEAK